MKKRLTLTSILRTGILAVTLCLLLIASASAITNIESISLSKSTLRLWTGDTETLQATITPENATYKVIKWESSNTNVATVDDNGAISAKSKGQTTITATTVDGQRFASCVVTVHQGATVSEFQIWETRYGTQLETSDQTYLRNHRIDVSWSPVIYRANYTEDYDLFSTVSFVVSSDDGKTYSFYCQPYIVNYGNGYDYMGNTLEEYLPAGKTYTITATLVLGYNDGYSFIEKERYESNTITITLPSCSYYKTSFEPEYLAKEATCGSPAQYYANCEYCGVNHEKTFSRGEINPENHPYGEWVQLDEAYHSRACECGWDYETEDHSWDDGAITTKPTEETEGEKTFTCTVCQGTKTEKVDKLEHVFTEYISNNDATCTADGTETASCDYGCGATDTRTVVGSQLEHSFTEYTPNNDATYFADGTETASCDYKCGATDSRTVANSKLPSVASGTCGDNLTWALDNDGVLTLSGTGAMEDYRYYTGIGFHPAPWSNYRANIKRAVITEGVTNIGNHAFYECEALVDVSIPSSVSTIGEAAFDRCKTLVDVSIPGSVTTIGGSAFFECYALKTVAIGNGVQTISSLAFASCKSLTEVTIPASVTTIEARPFHQCKSLETVIVDEANPNYCSVDGVLFDKDMTTLLNYPAGKRDTYYAVPDGVVTIDDWSFFQCTILTEVVVPDSVVTIGRYVFYGAEHLEKITLGCGVETIGMDAFSTSHDSTRRGLVIFTGNAPEISPYAFSDCFYFGCVYPENDPTWTEDKLVSYGADNLTWARYVSEDFGDGLTWTLEANGTLTISGVGAIPDYESYADTPWVVRARAVRAIVISDGITSIGKNAFSDCINAQSIIVGKDVNSIHDGAFGRNSGPNFWINENNVNYSSEDGVLFNKAKSALISYPFLKHVSIYVIPDSVVAVGGRAFEGCHSLTAVTIPNSVTTIGNRAFYDCSALATVIIPDSVTSISNYAFYNCDSLTEVTIPDSVVAIGERAFYSCDSLATVTIGSGVTSIEYSAFAYCSSLSSVTFKGNAPTIVYNSFFSTEPTCYYPASNATWKDAMKQNYGGTITWKSYAAPTPLPAPATFTVAVSASSGKPVISWSTVESATGYEVWRCDTKAGTYTKLTAVTPELTFTDTGAVVGNDYFYKVRTLNDGIAGTFTAAKGVWCDLARPTVTVKNRASDGKPTISWTAVEGATGYEVYRCGTSGGTYTKLITTAATKLSVTHTGAAVGNDYFYKVKALYGPNASCNSALTAAKGVWVDLKQPTVKVLNSISTGKPVIQWEKVDYAVGYKVYMSETSGGTYKLLYGTTNPDKLSVTHTGAKAENDYFYKVVAVHKNSKCDSAMSAAKGVWCDLARPTMSVSLNAKNKPYLTWSKITGADKYEVYVSANGGAYRLLYTASAAKLNVTHTGAVSGNIYTYKVRPVSTVNSKANGSYSTVKSVTIP